MKFTASFELTESYFRENYQEWLNHRSRWRRWQRHFGALTIAIGVALLFVPGLGLAGAMVAGFGCSQIIIFYLAQSRWLKQRVAARASNPHQRVEMTFDESGIDTEGPTSKGTMSWIAVKAAYPTENGLIFSFGDGMAMYVPNTGMSNVALRDFAVEMVSRRSANVDQ